jgi:hypothetical protein
MRKSPSLVTPKQRLAELAGYPKSFDQDVLDDVPALVKSIIKAIFHSY